ncbi:MAG: DUF5666 domain-containing protein [Terracidiphilus sp.]|nr:DUF5666 domain-containing protein [Terracidiphilus sp.]
MLPVIVFVLALSAATAQDAPSAAPAGQGQYGGRGGMGSMMGRGMGGTVTAVAADHYTVKNENGETYTVYYSVNTRIMKQAAQPHGRGQGGQGMGAEAGSSLPQTLRSFDIKVGDAILVMGEVDAAAKSVGATVVLQVDPERAKQMREMQANYGKTWLMGKVTGVDGVKVTLQGSVDNAAHSFVADENTTFRKHREPITLGDIAVGDMVRVEGAVKDGAFVASTVTAMGVPPGGGPNVPRGDQPR